MSLATRLASSAVLIPAVLAAVFWAPPLVFAAVMALIAALAAGEWFALHDRRPLDRVPALVLAAALPLGLELAGEAFWGLYLAALLLLLGLTTVVRRDPPPARMAAVTETAGAGLFVAVPLGFFVLLRAAGGGRAVGFLLAVIWSADTAAYLVGAGFGRRRMSPVLSPKKTLEGLAGAAAAGAAAGGLLSGPFLAWPAALGAAAGLTLAMTGQLGDLLESLWKRAVGRKDSGSIIPGHGGLLDRIDSFLLAAPVFHVLTRVLRP